MKYPTPEELKNLIDKCGSDIRIIDIQIQPQIITIHIEMLRNLCGEFTYIFMPNQSGEFEYRYSPSVAFFLKNKDWFFDEAKRNYRGF